VSNCLVAPTDHSLDPSSSSVRLFLPVSTLPVRAPPNPGPSSTQSPRHRPCGTCPTTLRRRAGGTAPRHGGGPASAACDLCGGRLGGGGAVRTAAAGPAGGVAFSTRQSGQIRWPLLLPPIMAVGRHPPSPPLPPLLGRARAAASELRRRGSGQGRVARVGTGGAGRDEVETRTRTTKMDETRTRRNPDGFTPSVEI
jgi:hypothetical protein